jgi:hypothetical protein
VAEVHTLKIFRRWLYVVVLGDAEYTIKQNGRKIVYEDVVFLFHFNEAGKVQKFAHRNDTHQAWLAYHNK